MTNKIIQLKKLLRKSVAQKELLLKHLTGKEREDIITSIATDKSVYNNIEKYSFLDMYNLYSKNSVYNEIFKTASERFPIFSDLITVLSDNEDKERSKCEENPTSMSIKRWALRAAVLEYYSELGFGVDQKIISIFGSDKLDSNFAPNQKQIYNKWLKLLTDAVRNDTLSQEELSEIAEKGFGRGSSFEKQLDRYREDFVKDIWYKISEE